MNGHIKMEKLRESRAKRDMYRVRGDALVKKAIKMENLTDCLAKLKVEPIWKDRKAYEHKSERFECPDFNRSNVTASMSYMDDSLHVTSVKKARTQPGKKTTNKGVLYNQNVCQLSHVKHESKADI